jgi:iron complex outermembrane receptor protein
MRRHDSLRHLIATLAATGALGGAQAQTASPPPAAAVADEGKLQSVTVTANRRSEPLQKVAAPVTAIDSSTLRDGRLQSLESLVGLVPNASLPDTTGVSTNKDIVIRGVSNPDPSSAVEPGFGIFRDGNYYGGTIVNFGAAVDLQRVEVLRGPQGGLYGRNAVGGALNLIYNRPKFGNEFRIDGLVGSFGTRELDAVANLPLLADRLALRIVAWDHARRGGEIRNSTLGENIDRLTDRGARLGLRLAATARLQADWTFESQRSSTPERADFFSGPYTIRNLAQAPIATLTETETTIARDTLSRLENNFDYLAQELSYDADAAGSFTLVTTLRKYRQTGSSDQDFASLDPSVALGFARQVLNRRTTTENRFVELRWQSVASGALTGVGGLSYYTESLDSNRLVDISLSSLALGVPPPASLLPGQVGFKGQVDSKSWSAFAEGNYKFTPQWTGTASLRYTSDKKTLDYSQGSNPALPLHAVLGGIFVPYAASQSKSFTNWSPAVGLSFQATPNQLFFGRVSTGFRSGGYNLTAPVSALAFDPEKATNVELGAKTDWLDNRLRLNAALFHTRQTDKLINQAEFAGTTLAYLANVGKARTNGAEFEASALVTRGLTLSAALGWLDAQVTQGQSTLFGTTTDLAGKKVAYAPTMTGAITVQYRTPLSAGLALTAFGAYRHRDGGFRDNANTVKQASYDLFDASLGLAGKGWTLSLVARNLGDKRYITSATTVPGTGELVALSPGRWTGLRGSVEF